MIGSDYVLEAHNIYHTAEVSKQWKNVKINYIYFIFYWTVV